MADDAQAAITSEIDKHFNRLVFFVNRLQSKWPSHTDFINVCMKQCATRIVTLYSSIEDVQSTIQPWLLSLGRVDGHTLPSLDVDGRGHDTVDLAPNAGLSSCATVWNGFTGLPSSFDCSAYVPVASNITMPVQTRTETNDTIFESIQAEIDLNNMLDMSHSVGSQTLRGADYDTLYVNSMHPQPMECRHQEPFPSSVLDAPLMPAGLKRSHDLAFSVEDGGACLSTAAVEGGALNEREAVAMNAEQRVVPVSKRRKLQHTPPSSLCFSVFEQQFWVRLKTRVRAQRTSADPHVVCDLGSISSTFYQIDRLDRQQRLNALRRRFFLYHFAAHREQLFRDVQNSRSQSNDKLVTEIFPQTIDAKSKGVLRKWRTRYEFQRKKIKNRSQAAKNWWRAAKLFHLGILILIPCTEDSGWQDSKFERMTDEQREALFATWRDQNGTPLSTAAAQLSPLVQTLVASGDDCPFLALEAMKIPEEIAEDDIDRLLEEIPQDQAIDA